MIGMLMMISKLNKFPHKFEFIILIAVILINFFPIHYVHQMIEAGICAADGLQPTIWEYKSIQIAACGPERDFDMLFRAGGGLFFGLFFSALAAYSFARNFRIGLLFFGATAIYQFSEMYLMTNVAYLFNTSPPVGHFFLLFLSTSAAFFILRKIPIMNQYKFQKPIITISEVLMMGFGTIITSFVITYLLYPQDAFVVIGMVVVASSAMVITYVAKKMSTSKIVNNFYFSWNKSNETNIEIKNLLNKSAV